jgi:serine phosphatase RsbU (regulator of sigma subunit)
LVIGHRNSVTASACLVVIDTVRSTLSYLLAGHPPPLIRGGEGQVRMLDGGRQPLLGIPTAPLAPVTVPFGPGSVLVAYTDGLIERRHEMIDTSIDRLRRSLGSCAATDPELLADQIIADCLDGLDPNDDVALVVIGRD